MEWPYMYEVSKMIDFCYDLVVFCLVWSLYSSFAYYVSNGFLLFFCIIIIFNAVNCIK